MSSRPFGRRRTDRLRKRSIGPAEKIYLECIEPIKHRMKSAVYRIVRNPDDAADAFQDALFKIWNYLDRIVEHPNPHAYVLSICVSSAHDLLRKKMRQAGNVPLIEEASTTSRISLDTRAKSSRSFETPSQRCRSNRLKPFSFVFSRTNRTPPLATFWAARRNSPLSRFKGIVPFTIDFGIQKDIAQRGVPVMDNHKLDCERDCEQ